MAETADEVRAAIAEDRAQLADTVQALVEKTDVKARLHDKTANMAERVRQLTPQQARSGAGAAAQEIQRRPIPYAVVAAFVVGLLIGRRLGSRR